MSAFRLSDVERRLANIIRIGSVVEANYEKARVRVDIGGNTTAWLPWIAQRAGGDRVWHPPDQGEQVIVIAPSGELTAGVVLPGGIYKNDRPPNGDKVTTSRISYGDGAVVEYDQESHAYLLQIPSDGKVTVTVGEDKSKVVVTDQSIELSGAKASLTIDENGLTIKGPVKILGQVTQEDQKGLTVTGPVRITGELVQEGGPLKSNEIVFHTHTHGGVMTGSGTSSPPAQ